MKVGGVKEEIPFPFLTPIESRRGALKRAFCPTSLPRKPIHESHPLKNPTS